MIAHYDIVQQTEEWYRIKWGKVGGTRAKGLFVKSDTLMLDLLAEITEPFEIDDDSYASSDMLRGVELEPIARANVSDYIGIELNECGWLQSVSHPLLGISVDGISFDETVTAEIKCPGAKKHLATCLANDIPLDNIDQAIHYFTVNPKCERHIFASFRPESIKPLFVKELTRSSIVNIGTKAKPVMMEINKVVELAHKAEVELRAEIAKSIEQLKF